MLTLTYGYKKPETNDLGPVVFPALEDNIDRLNSHNHDGSNSSKIPTSSLTHATQSIPAGSWALVAGGLYKQTVTLAASLNFDNLSLQFRLSSGDLVYPTVVRVSTSQYDIYLNDNTETLTAVYS